MRRELSTLLWSLPRLWAGELCNEVGCIAVPTTRTVLHHDLATVLACDEHRPTDRAVVIDRLKDGEWIRVRRSTGDVVWSPALEQEHADIDYVEDW